MQDIRVPVPAGSESKSYYKYFNRELLPIPDEKLELLKNPFGNPADGMSIKDMNKLFEPGYLPGELGIFKLPEGGAVVCNLTPMPNCTGEMAEWWFGWHGADPLRYAIWDPCDHFSVQLSDDDIKKVTDPSIPVALKSQGVSHHVTESLIPGTPASEIILNFTDPKLFNMPIDKIHTDACSYVLCANVEIVTPPEVPNMPVVCVHHFRNTEYGCELRSRFWIGYQIINGEGKCLLPPGMEIPEKIMVALLQHNFFEYVNLAELLPSIYAEEKDNW